MREGGAPSGSGDGLERLWSCDGCTQRKGCRRVWSLLLCQWCARRANWNADRLGLSVRVVVGEEYKRVVAELRAWLKAVPR